MVGTTLWGGFNGGYGLVRRYGSGYGFLGRVYWWVRPTGMDDGGYGLLGTDDGGYRDGGCYVRPCREGLMAGTELYGGKFYFTYFTYYISQEK